MCLLKKCFQVYDLPLHIVSRPHFQFTSAVWKAFSTSDGETTFLCVVSSSPSTWSALLPWVEYAHNALVTSAIAMSPFQCVFGFQPPLFPFQEKDTSVPSVKTQARRCHNPEPYPSHPPFHLDLQLPAPRWPVLSNKHCYYFQLLTGSAFGFTCKAFVSDFSNLLPHKQGAGRGLQCVTFLLHHSLASRSCRS